MSYSPSPHRLEVSERRHLTWLHAVLVLLGGWIALSPGILHPARQQELHVVVGAAIVLISGLYAVRLAGGKSVSSASEWMIGLLGILILATTIVGGVRAGGLLWSDVIAGGFVVIIASYVIYSTRRT